MSIRIREKRAQQQKYLRRKNYIDPSFLLKKNTKNSRSAIKEWNDFFKRIVKNSMPYSLKLKDNICRSDYSEYIKLVHFVGLKNLRPPYWFRTQATNFLFNLYEKWKSYADKLGQDYYLKIWIYEEEFSRSELVFGLNNKIRRYDNIFEDSPRDQKISFLSSELLDKLMKYNIKYQKEMEPVTKEDLNEILTKDFIGNCISPIYRKNIEIVDVNRSVMDNINYFIDNNIVREIDNENEIEPFYMVHIDNVWVLSK